MLSYLQWFEIYIKGTHLEFLKLDKLEELYNNYLKGLKNEK